MLTGVAVLSQSPWVAKTSTGFIVVKFASLAFGNEFSPSFHVFDIFLSQSTLYSSLFEAVFSRLKWDREFLNRGL